MTFYSYCSSYCWPSLVHVYSVDYWFDISVFWVVGIIPYAFFDVIWFSLAWPPTASSVDVSIEVARSFSCRVPCCKHFFGHTVPHEVSRFSTPETVVSVVIVIIVIIVVVRVCFFLLFSKELLDCCGEDFQLSCHLCFRIVAIFWLGHHKPCLVLLSYIYCCL